MVAGYRDGHLIQNQSKLLKRCKDTVPYLTGGVLPASGAESLLFLLVQPLTTLGSCGCFNIYTAFYRRHNLPIQIRIPLPSNPLRTHTTLGRGQERLKGQLECLRTLCSPVLLRGRIPQRKINNDSYHYTREEGHPNLASYQ